MITRIYLKDYIEEFKKGNIKKGAKHFVVNYTTPSNPLLIITDEN